MATIIREVLTSASMNLAIYCGGKSYVGLRLAGTWVGTVKFYGSTDGVNFNLISMTPFASGTAVQSATANGNWFIPVQNYVVIKAIVDSYTSGSVTVVMAASADSSYQDAFLTPTSIYVNSAATNALNTLTQAAQTNRAWCLKKLVVSVNGTPSWLTSPNLQILDGTTVLWQVDLELVGSSGYRYVVDLPDNGITGTPGNALVVKVAAAGSAKTSQINAEFSAA